MNHFLNTFLNSLTLLIEHVPTAIGVIAVLWLIHVLNWCCRYRLNILGIYPRNVWGLIGILFSPMLHKDFRHLFLNSIPLFILLSFIFLYGTVMVIQLTLVIVLFSGMGIWLFGRKGIHIGASAVVMGYFGFILAVAIRTHLILPMVIAAVCVFYLGSLFGSLFPTKKAVSWEGHLAGFLAGIGFVFF